MRAKAKLAVFMDNNSFFRLICCRLALDFDSLHGSSTCMPRNKEPEYENRTPPPLLLLVNQLSKRLFYLRPCNLSLNPCLGPLEQKFKCRYIQRFLWKFMSLNETLRDTLHAKSFRKLWKVTDVPGVWTTNYCWASEGCRCWWYQLILGVFCMMIRIMVPRNYFKTKKNCRTKYKPEHEMLTPHTGDGVLCLLMY